MTMTRRQAVLAGCGLAATPVLYGQGRQSNPPTQLAGAAQAEVRRVNLFDYEQGARERLPHTAWEYINCGAGDEITLRWNREAFDQIRVRPQILVDVSKLDTRVTLFGQELPFPILLAPAAYHRIVHPEGELATVRGAGTAGATMVVSSLATTAVEEIARAAIQPW